MSSTTNNIVVLKENQDWPLWFAVFERMAHLYGVAQYALPGTNAVILKPVYEPPDFHRLVNAAAYLNVCEIYLIIYQIEEKAYRRVRDSLDELYEWVMARVDERHLLGAPATASVREIVEYLKQNLSTSADQEREQARREYTTALRAVGCTPEDWFVDWIMAGTN